MFLYSKKRSSSSQDEQRLLELKTVFSGREGFFEFFLLDPDSALVASMQDLSYWEFSRLDEGESGGFEGWQECWCHPWFHLSMARWDGEDECLTLSFWDRAEQGRGRRKYYPQNSPSAGFMDLVREGISATQVFSTRVEFPSGISETIHVLRDDSRNFWVEPRLGFFEKTIDQEYFLQRLSRMEQSLGVKVIGDTSAN